MNPLSSHVTLHYLPKEIDSEYLDKIKEILERNLSSDFDMDISGINCFVPNKKTLILYLEPTIPKSIKTIRDELIDINPFNEITDNGYEYIPHITLGKVQSLDDLDDDSIKKIISELFQIIQIFITQKKLAETLGIFRVNSLITPELQFPIFSKKLIYDRTT
ncbi:2'-5' RNA ligase family protein [Candidatus Gracilibacteria bacterium]|nr:2'-5' RNA ligase family protein [Candidatus Gracilibacteria bacterium]